MRWLRPMRQDLSRWLYHREGKERSGIKRSTEQLRFCTFQFGPKIRLSAATLTLLKHMRIILLTFVVYDFSIKQKPKGDATI